MNKIVSLLTLLLVGVGAWAASPMQNAESPLMIEMLSNPGLESGLAGLTKSGGTLSPVTSGTNLYHGGVSALWTPSAGSQTVTTKQFMIPNGLYGKNCAGKLAFKSSEATNLYTLNVIDGSSNVLASVTAPVSANSFADLVATFICPSSGTLALQLKAASSTPGAGIAFDDMHLGSNYLLSQVSQAKIAGTADQPGGANCIFSEGSSTGENNYTSLSTAASCASTWSTTGDITAVGTTSSQIQYNNMPPGEYEIDVEGFFGGDTASQVCNWAISDGSSSIVGYNATYGNTQYGSHISNRVAYTTAGNRTFSIVAADNGAGNCQISNNVAGRHLTWIVKRFPNSSQQAYQPDQTPANGAAYHDNTCLWTRTSASAGSPTGDSTCNFVNRPSTNLTLASTTDGSGDTPGIQFQPPRIGKYNVCVSGQFSDASASEQDLMELVDGAGSVLSSVNSANTIANVRKNYTLCGHLNVTSLTSLATAKLYFWNGGGGTAITVDVNSNLTAALNWTVEELDAPMTMPILVNGVTSSSSGIERIERVTTSNADCASSPCGISSATPGITSVTRTGTGAYTINFAPGTFSGPPLCIANAGRNGGRLCQVSTPASNCTTTSCNVSCIASATLAAFDADPHAICMGPH